MAKTVYVLCGLPGSGKTTWTHKTFHGEVAVVSSDDIIQEIARDKGTTYNDEWSKYVKAASQMCWDNYDRFVSEGYETIVVDRTNVSAKSRTIPFLRAKYYPKQKYRFVAVVFPKPPEEEWKRRLNRPGKTIPQAALDSMSRKFEYPTIAEGFDEIIEVNND